MEISNSKTDFLNVEIWKEIGSSRATKQAAKMFKGKNPRIATRPGWTIQKNELMR